MARLKHRVVFAPEACDDYRRLSAFERAEVKDVINVVLVHQPTLATRSRVKRLRGTCKPQYRLRVGGVRVFYDVRGGIVEVLAIVEKTRASEWLREKGDSDEESSTS